MVKMEDYYLIYLDKVYYFRVCVIIYLFFFKYIYKCV